MMKCSLGVGCEQSGVCYADAHGQPEQCGREDVKKGPDPEERERADKDSQLLGTGFLVDGVRVDPSRVTMIRKAHWPLVTSTEHYRELERVLIEKGATPEWLDYALPDLVTASSQYANSKWVEGFKWCEVGNPIPNPQD